MKLICEARADGSCGGISVNGVFAVHCDIHKKVSDNESGNFCATPAYCGHINKKCICVGVASTKFINEELNE